MATPPLSSPSLTTNLKGGISSSLTGVTEPDPRLDFTDLPLSLLSSHHDDNNDDDSADED